MTYRDIKLRVELAIEEADALSVSLQKLGRRVDREYDMSAPGGKPEGVFRICVKGLHASYLSVEGALEQLRAEIQKLDTAIDEGRPGTNTG